MAENESQSHGIEELKEMVECCICAKTFNDPRLLPCSHSFCLRCLQETRSKTGKEIGDKMACPLCTVEFIIPPNGLSSLQKNFFVEKLMNLPGLKSLTPTAKRINCDVCMGDRAADAETEFPAAEIFCEDCHQTLCKDCFKQHGRFQVTKSHKVSTIGNQDNTEMLSELHSQESCIHRGRVNLDIFCSDCKTVVCALCFLEIHQMHKGADATKVADDFRKSLKESANELSERLSEVEEKLSLLDHNKDEFLKVVEDLENDVRQRFEDLKRFGEKQMQALLSELENVQWKRLKEIENIKLTLDQHRVDLESTRLNCDQLSCTASVKSVCHGMHDSSQKIDDLKSVHRQHMQKKLDPFQATLKKTEFESLVSSVSNNILGSFEIKEYPAISEDLKYDTKIVEEPFAIHTYEPEASPNTEYLGICEDVKHETEIVEESIAFDGHVLTWSPNTPEYLGISEELKCDTEVVEESVAFDECVLKSSQIAHEILSPVICREYAAETCCEESIALEAGAAVAISNEEPSSGLYEWPREERYVHSSEYGHRVYEDSPRHIKESRRKVALGKEKVIPMVKRK